MSDFESKIDINIDAGQALAAIKTLQRQISDFHTSLAKGSATANIKSLQMQQTLIDTINSTGQYSASMKTVASSTQAFTTALEKNKLSMGQYFKYAGGASKSFGRFFKTEMDTIQKVAIERVKDLQTQYIKMGREANGALKTIAVRPLALDMENLSTKTQIAAQKQQLLNQLLKQGSTNLLNFGKNTQWAGRQLMVGFTIPLGILGTTAAKTFMDMEKQAIAFKRVYGDTFTASKETDAMLKQVQQLASEFTKYGVAVEKTMEQAAKAAATGKMGADLLAQVSEATRLSVLGNVEQQQALETTISLTNAFGTAADQLRGKINFLNAVENQTITSIEDLTTAIPKAAPVIQQLGGDVEDLTFFLTAMREGGINASESANALKSGLASLINPTKKASDFLQTFGINITKIVEGNKGDVKGLVIDFAKALDTLDPLNRARAIEQLFGKFQFSRLSTLFQNVIKDGSQAAKVLELTRQSSAELGILAQRELNRIAASPMYKFEKAIADFKKELAPVGEEFLKAVTPIINFATDVLKAFNNLDGGVKQFIVNATGLIAGIGPVFLMTFGLLANGVANIIKGFTFVKNVFNKASSASTVLGETTDYMTQQQLEAASVAASLEQVHNKLTQAFTVEAGAVAKLTSAYEKAVAAQIAFTGPRVAGKAAPRPKKYADGVFSVPGPKGAGDVVPAMLSPGEAVIPAKMATKYSGFINGMISGNIPGFAVGKKADAPLSERLKVKGIADAPSYIRSQTRGMNWSSRDAEIAMARQIAQSYGIDVSGLYETQYLSTHASHIEDSSKRVGLGRGLFGNIKQWFAKNLMVDLGIVNKPLQDISHTNIKSLGATSSKRMIYDEFMNNSSTIAKELGMSESQVKKMADDIFAGKHPTNKKSASVAEKIFGIAEKQAGTPQAKARYGGARAVLGSRVADTSKNSFYNTIGQRKYQEDEAKRVADEKKRIDKQRAVVAAASEKEVKELVAKRKTAEKINNSVEQSAKKAGKAAVERNNQQAKTAKAQTRASKKAETKAQSQSKVASTPNVSVTEQLGNGVTRTVDANGKEKFRVNGKFASQQKAMAAASAGGAAAAPGGRVKRFFTGMGGKLAGAGMLASMAAPAVGGQTGDILGTVGNAVFTAALLKDFVPKGITSKFGKILEPFVKFIKPLAPMFLKLGIAVTVATTLFDVLTEKQRKQAEIDDALLKISTTTKEKLDDINNFFGTQAKLSALRTSGPVGLAETQAGASLAEQFRGSEEFKKNYQETANTLIGATTSEMSLALSSLAIDLMASGLDKEVVQIIVDAIKQEAKRTDVVIDVNSLSLDTEGGLKKLKEGINEALENYTKRVLEFDPFGFNTNGLKLSIQQVSNFLNGLGTAYQSAQVSTEDFNATFDAMIVKLRSVPDSAKVIYESLNALSPEIGALAKNIRNVESAALLLKLVMAGIGVSPEAIKILQMGDPKDLKAFRVAANKAFAEKDKQLKALAGKQKELAKVQENLQEQEQNINDKYDDRIKILERINDLQKQISDRQKGQLDLADALSRGDVFAAAKAVQDIRAKDAQAALDQQRQALEDQKAKETAAVQKSIGGVQKQIQNIESQILQVQNATITIDKYLAPEDYVKDALPKLGDTRAGAKNNLKVLKDSSGKQYFPVNLMDQYLNYPYTVSTKPGFTFPDKDGKQWKVVSSQDVGSDGIPDRAYVVPVEKADGGYISGPGSGTSDSIPARLSNGEYVVRAKAVEALGTDTLDQINYADKFAKGGLVQRFSEGGSPVPPPPIDWTKLDSWKTYNQNRSSVKLDSGQKHTMAQYIVRPLTVHLGTFESARKDLDRAIIDNRMSIAKGTDLVRVAAERDAKALSVLKPGQSFIIDQFMSVTSGKDKAFIGGMMSGTKDTGGRYPGGNYPLIKFDLKGNAPGIYDMNRILPNLPSGEKYSNVVDGLLARGQTAKLVNVTTNKETGAQTYHVELGGKSRAKMGLFQNLYHEEQKARLREYLASSEPKKQSTINWLQEKLPLNPNMPRYTGQSTSGSVKTSGGSYGSSMPTYGWSGTNQKFAVGKAKGGIIGKGPKRSSDSGLDWFNQFIQNLLGGGNPSGFMQSDTTKSLVADSYVQGAKNMGVDPTDPAFYASMFAPSMGIKALGMAGKGVSKLAALKTPRSMMGYQTYIPQAYVNFMRTNPRIAVRMQSEKFIDALNRRDFAYKNRYQRGDIATDTYDAMKEAEQRLKIEENVFGIPKDASPDVRPVYGAAVNTSVPWGLRGRLSSDAKLAKKTVQGRYSNVNSEILDRYGDISLLLKKRVNKRSTFTLGDSYSPKNFKGENPAVPAPFGTLSGSKILGANSGNYSNEFKFVEAQIYGGLPFSDIKKIIVRRPELIPMLKQTIAQSGLKIPVGQSKLSPLGKLMQMLNIKHKETGTPSFYKLYDKPYEVPKFKNGGMFRTPYAQGGLAMLHDKEFVMNPGAVKEYGVDKLKAMNNGTYNGGSVYNSYGVNINVDGSNTSANDIARTVIREIKRLDSQNLRSTAV